MEAKPKGNKDGNGPKNNKGGNNSGKKNFTSKTIHSKKVRVEVSKEAGFTSDSLEWQKEVKPVLDDYPNLQIFNESDKDSKDYYFSSYAHFGIHEEMLKDSIRTRTYMNSIIQNPDLFKDKIVLDVGCGTGILSYFAVRAGAKHVYAVDCSDIIWQACDIAKNNGYDDKVSFIKGKVEHIKLPVEKVDIIISEWMGYFLLYESMLDSVIYARDKWMAKDGLMFPDKAILYVAGIEDAQYKEEKLEFWNDVYGVNMSCMKDTVMQEPLVDVVEGDAITTNICPILDLDLQTCTTADLDFVSAYSLKMAKRDYVHALVAWFDCKFTHGSKVLNLSTSPNYKSTHWKQTVLYFEGFLIGNAGEEMEGSIAVRKNPGNPRYLDIKLSLHFDGENNKLHKNHFYQLA
eukprot:CAMPEP_0114995660 /NCGR_PEP_ID=MMETSP0216-20121206/13858_1 /TAXON_ID=223996 /ORGANISM="Protocruzia adherens, Strain Boccale" /LENGTH=401 /DNA_ID=CAMNT_0002359737 /DNA_START=112 /DNA_END=1317 /DNA_ORIENTATION=-